MEILYPRCCGLDVHKKTIVACVLVTGPEGTVQQEVRTFATMTDELLALADWLAVKGVSHVAMESTGVYWKPVYNVLEGSFTLLLVNAQHIKAVPGRKTDVKDAEWLADPVRHGLIKPSFVPPPPVRELRDLVAPVAAGGPVDRAQPHAQAARDGEHQARQRRERGVRRLRDGDAAGAGRGRGRPGGDGRAGAGQAT
jgi:Transposase